MSRVKILRVKKGTSLWDLYGSDFAYKEIEDGVFEIVKSRNRWPPVVVYTRGEMAKIIREQRVLMKEDAVTEFLKRLEYAGFEIEGLDNGGEPDEYIEFTTIEEMADDIRSVDESWLDIVSPDGAFTLMFVLGNLDSEMIADYTCTGRSKVDALEQVLTKWQEDCELEEGL